MHLLPGALTRAELLALHGKEADTGIVGGNKVSGKFVSVRRWQAGEHLEQRRGWRHVRGAHASGHTHSAHPGRRPAPPRHSSEPWGLEGGKDALKPSGPVKMSLCLQPRFISASDSAGPVGSTTARRWGPSKERLAVRSAAQTGDQSGSSADTAAKRNPGAPQPTSTAPQGTPHFVSPQADSSALRPPHLPSQPASQAWSR